MNIPVEVLNLLKKEKFCFLATSYQDYPHVCLMNFTYLADEGLIILSSREDTTKVNHIKKNPEVAILFYNLGGRREKPISCTLNGIASLLSPDNDQYYRDYHYKKNFHMGTFIIGENIVVITVRVTQITLSDVEDRVRTWTQDPSV